MLERTGLTSCMNTIVGNQFIHGLSGGQKRRLSVAVALMKKLDVIFLDEPTTGLDSAASAGKHPIESLRTTLYPSYLR